MATPFYKVNDVDMIPYLIDQGLSWSEEDIDEENSGRTLDGVMHRGLVARKDKHTLAFRELNLEETRIVTNVFDSEYVEVSTNFHPKRAGIALLTMYNSSRTAAIADLDEDGTAYWYLGNIALIER